MNFSSTTSIEVTHEDFQQQYDNKKLKRFRFRNLLPKKPNPACTHDNTLTAELMSVANFTVTSNDTVKASNRTRKQKKIGMHREKMRVSNERQKSTSDDFSENGWDKLRKKFMGTKSNESKAAEPSSTNNDTAHARGDVTSKSSPKRRGLRERVVKDTSQRMEERRILLDDAIRGRMDGMDVLSLGPARLASIRRSQSLDDGDLFIETMNEKWTPSKMVMDMILTSAGRDPAEMVLEGFKPGGEDRWRVHMEELEPLVFEQDSISASNGRYSPVPALSPTEDSECGSSITCGEEDITSLMGSMWGTQKPPPTHTKPQPKQQCEDDVLQMASDLNVPIDVDEETFVVETANHLRSVHDIASICLGRQDYDGALVIFYKILKGLKLRHEEEPHFLIGTTLHNIGVVQMWQGKFAEALYTFQQAIAVRIIVLPPKHPDIAVSLVRQGFAQFAMNRFKDAVESFTQALELCTIENATRAKILNNLGVVQYQEKHFIQALQSFTRALEIQRKLLEGPIRRESIIFDATTTLRNMGKLYLTNNDVKTGFIVFEEATLVSFPLQC